MSCTASLADVVLIVRACVESTVKNRFANGAQMQLGRAAVWKPGQDCRNQAHPFLSCIRSRVQSIDTNATFTRVRGTSPRRQWGYAARAKPSR